MTDQINSEEPGSIPHFGLTMVRPNMLGIPEAAMPGGYSIRTFRDGDEEHWARIEQAAGEFKSAEAALRRFRDEFGGYTDEMEQRCLFVTDERDIPIGTTTAWYGELDGSVIGRIHWVAVVPEHQGRKLSKPLLSAALRTMARFHDKAYLTTQTTSYKAVGMYLNYGFEPVIRTPECADGWKLMERLLGRSIVAER
ncbi:GNAT family N-acetyltransferase [Paenibacillus mesophilus]|uniref:GNAT family N-acetyltransferase n=1 Tax=Paenibacillus mesophilus TaxID=2582849 RepID=UPI00110D4235|nr:GNAT family N-acetyltransferase [Paenibacillus mesophilus]TMV52138.1 GNAT family N-acetyltransferase [Paenibacillus mesophilus]